MLQRFVDELIDKYVIPFATVDEKVLSVGIRNGQVILKDVTLKPSAFDNLGFPLVVKSGRVDELRINFSWENYAAKPAQIVFDGIHVVLSPSANEPSSDLVKQQNNAAEKSDLVNDLLARQERIHGQRPFEEREQSFFFKLVSRIMGNLQVKVSNIHIRYEDGSSDPANPFVAGVMLDCIELLTTDLNWKAADWVPSAEILHKVLQLSGLAVYWQHNLEPWKGAAAVIPAGATRASGDLKVAAYYVLDPLDAKARIIVNRDGSEASKTPRFSLESDVGDTRVRLDCAMLRDLGTLVEAAALHENRQRTAGVERPAVNCAGNCKAWWKYAIKCVSAEVRSRRETLRLGNVLRSIRQAKDYLPLFKRILSSNRETGLLSDEELAKMDALEAEMPRHAIMALRGRAEDMVEQENRIAMGTGQVPGRPPSAQIGLLDRLFRGWRRGDSAATKEVAGATLTLSEPGLLEFVGAAPEQVNVFDDFERERPEYERYRVKVEWGGVKVAVSDLLSRTGEIGAGVLAVAVVNGLSFSAVGHPGPQFPFEMQFALRSVGMDDHVTKGSLFTSVLAMVDAASAAPVLSVRFVRLPLDGHSTYVLDVESSRFRIVNNVPLFRRLAKYVQHAREGEFRALTALVGRNTAQGLDQQRSAVQSAIRWVLDTRNPTDLSLRIALPDVLLVQNGAGAGGDDPASIIVVRLGRLDTKSTIAAMKGDLKGLRDTCEVDWTGFEVCACSAVDSVDTHAAETAVIRADRLSTRFEVAADRFDFSQQQLKVTQALEGLSISVSGESIRRVALVLRSMIGDGEAVAKAVVSKDLEGVSTMMGVASGWFRMFQQGWDTLQRREMGILRAPDGSVSPAILQSYSEWRRAEFSFAMPSVSACLVQQNVGSASKRELLRIELSKTNMDALVRSLDAQVKASLGSMEIVDLVQQGTSKDLSDDFKYILRSRIPSTGRGVEDAAQFQLSVYHRKSPQHSGIDVLLQATCFQLQVGSNLDTLAVLQNFLVDSLEPALSAFKDEVSALKVDALALKDFEKRIQLELESRFVGTVASRPHPFSLRFEGTLHACDVSLFTERSGLAFPILRLQVRNCSMTNEESRAGQIDVKGSIVEASLWDGTPSGTVHPCIVSKAESAKAADLVTFSYSHHGRKNSKDPAARTDHDAAVQVRIAAVSAVCSPRLVTETVAYIYESSVFSSNLVAIRSAASSTANFRRRLDPVVITHTYRMGLDLRLEGGLLFVPVSSTSKDGFALRLNPLSVTNRFAADDGGAAVGEVVLAKLEGVRLVSRRGDDAAERDLITFAVECEARRRMGLGRASQGTDSALLSVVARIGTVSVNVGKQELSLVWRSAAANIAEVKGALNTIGSGKARRRKDRSVLDLSVVHAALKDSLQQAALEDKLRQDLQAPASAPQLDLSVEFSLEALKVTVEAEEDLGKAGSKGKAAAAPGPQLPYLEAEVAGLRSSLQIWSDTSYALDAGVAALSLSDVLAGSRNLHRDIVRTNPGDAGALQMQYREGSDGNGAAELRSSGFRVTLAAEPILAILSMVSDSYSAPDADAGGAEAPDAPPPAAGEAEEMYSWWLDATLSVRAELGPCEVVLLQNCQRAPTPSLRLAWTASGTYSASRLLEEGLLEVSGVELYTLVPEQSQDPLHLLEKSSVTVTLRRAYEACRCASQWKVSSRALDFLVTYQDLRTLYWMYKAYERAVKGSSLLESRGVKAIVASLPGAPEEVATPRSVASAAGPPLAGEMGSAALQVQLEYVSVCVTNDCMGAAVPFLTVSARTTDAEVVSRAGGGFSAKVRTVVDAHYYNVTSSVFEPVLEPCAVAAEYEEQAQLRGSRLRLSAQSRIEVNVSEMHMRGLVQTVETWVQDGKTWVEDPDAAAPADKDKPAEKFWPYRLRNESGLPLAFWLGSGFDPAEETERKALAVGGEEPFNFSHKRIMQSRQREVSVEHHTLSIKFEGIADLLTHVPVDIVGVHMLPLGDLRAVAEVHNDSGSKIVAIQSTFKLYNKTSRAVEAAAYAERGDAEPVWREVLSGDIHSCVPLHLSAAKFLRIRPVHDGAQAYAQSDMVEVPTQPVTGESVMVACAEAGGGGGTVFFRVRLDAKRPVGGHEESMRIVISVHPAFRVMNALPVSLTACVLVDAGRGSPAQLEAVHTEQGAMTQLYCSDLRAPLLMSASTSLFRRVRDPVLVYHPDAGAATAKTLVVADDQGGQLALGVETTRSAWGDLTVVVFAQYLLLNFTGLPLVYGPYARTTAIKPAPGQPAPGEGAAAATPTKDGAGGGGDGDSTWSDSSAFSGLYTVFGPRSAFAGRPVAVVPPLADGDIENADEVRGNVAVIHRGVVPFIEKARRAAAAGAVGVLFVNSDDAAFLAEGDNGPGVRIPCAVVARSDGAALELGPAAGRIAVRPEDHSSRHRASSNQLEWKRQVKALVRVDGSPSSPGTPALTPDKRGGGADGGRGGGSAKKGGAGRAADAASLPDSWMEQPGDAPFMFSYDAFDLTGNKLCVSLRGAEWSQPFSLESVGTHGVLAAKGLPSALPSLQGALPLYEFGLSFSLGAGHFSRSKVASIWPRYTVVNRLGLTLQLAQCGLEEVPAALLEVRDGDCQTFHWPDAARAKAVLARVVPTIGTLETYTTGWGGPLQPEQVGTFAVRLPGDGAAGGGLDAVVDTRVRKGACFIVFRREKEGGSQYAVHNKSARRLVVCQEGGAAERCGRVVEPGARLTYCWDRPHDRRALVVAVDGLREAQTVAMDEFSAAAWGGGALSAEVRAEGPTRCLVVGDGGAAARRGDEERSEAASEDERGRHRLDVALAGFGVSIVDARLEEMLYASALGIDLSYVVTKTDIEVELKVQRVQVDNQTDKGPEVVLGPDPTKASDRPTVHLSLVKSRVYSSIPFFKFLSFGVREMDLELEETFIMRLLDAAQNVVDASTITVAEEKPDDLRDAGFSGLRFLGREAPAGEKCYFELLELQPVLVNLSFYGTGAILQRASSEGGGLSYNPMFASLKALGVVITTIDRAPIALNALVLERPFASQRELVASVRNHYRTQLIQQLYKLVGSFEFLGNPVGLVNNLGTGVHDFFYEPAQGITKSPAEFLKGVSKGSSSLFSHSTYGLMNAASKVTGSAAKSLAQLTGDEDYIRRRQEGAAGGGGGGQRQRQAAARAQPQDLGTDIADGFMGIFAKPMAGAKQGGATGFFSGLGKGLLGAVVKPTAGLMDLASKGAEGIKQTAKATEVIARVRPPRPNAGDGMLRPYDARAAHGQDAMRRLDDGGWDCDRYVGFCVLDADATAGAAGGDSAAAAAAAVAAGQDLAVVVTDRRVCVHRFQGCEAVWARPVGEVAAVAAEPGGCRVGLEARAGSPWAREWVACPDARSAEYLADIVRRAVGHHAAESCRRGGGAPPKSGEYML